MYRYNVEMYMQVHVHVHVCCKLTNSFSQFLHVHVYSLYKCMFGGSLELNLDNSERGEA